MAGARPNFIKIAPLLPALEAAGHQSALVHTGQHYDSSMSDVFFHDLQIPEPNWFLHVGSGTQAVQTGKAMMALEELLVAERPDAIVVVGDVNSTLAGALAATKLRIPVVHLEAGLRSFDMAMPEEINRLVTDQLSSLCLTTTREACTNLSAEGVEAERINFVGNIMAESLLRNMDKVKELHPGETWGLAPGEYALATIHRPENTDDPAHMEAITAALSALEMPVLLPAHPRTLPLLVEQLGEDSSVRLIEPVGYLDMLALQREAALVVTDSGGLQEEACMLGTPCVTIRRNTERAITVEVGANRLARADVDAILSACAAAIEAPRDWQRPELWDDGVAQRVCDALAGGIPQLRGM